MRLRNILYILMVSYVLIGLAIYLDYIYQFGAPVQLSIFSQADLQLSVNSNVMYNLFMLFPMMVGTFAFLKEYHQAMQILPYGTKKNIFFKQIKSGVIWSVILAVSDTGMTLLSGMMWNKIDINWADANSYFCVVMHKLLPGVSFSEVFLMNTIALCVKNILVAFILIISWWAFSNVLYGILIVTGICFTGQWTPGLSWLLGSLTDDYNFWIAMSNKIQYGIALVLCLTVFTLLANAVVKRKEF